MHKQNDKSSLITIKIYMACSDMTMSPTMMGDSTHTMEAHQQMLPHHFIKLNKKRKEIRNIEPI